MKRKSLTLLLAFCLLWLVCFPATSHLLPQTTVNAVLGDSSFYARFGHLPDENTNENLRIQTHLAHVEKLLRSRVPDSIPASLHPRRQQMLNLLHQYWQQGVFPTQSAYRGRRPHFIDEKGNLCAVGYLVAKTAGRELAEKINKQYSYAYLPEMKSTELTSWAEKSGLTTTELAMVQPSYDDLLLEEFIPPRTLNPADESMRIYNTFLMTLIGLQTIITLFNISVELWQLDETYIQVKAIDEIASASVAGLLLGLLLVMPATRLEHTLPSLPIILAATAMSVPNIMMLMNFAERTSKRESPAEVGFFDTPDGYSSWGLHASMSF